MTSGIKVNYMEMKIKVFIALNTYQTSLIVQIYFDITAELKIKSYKDINSLNKLLKSFNMLKYIL